MTNLRDALEKAGVTPDNISEKISSAAEDGVDKIVDDVARLTKSAKDVAFPSLDDERPKLVEDNAEFAGVVDKIEQLVTGETDNPAPDEAATNEPAAPAADSTDTAPRMATPSEEADDSSLTKPAVAPDDNPPSPPPINLDSIPMLKTGGLTDKAAPADAAAAAAEITAENTGIPTPIGGFAETLQSIDSQESEVTAQTVPSLPAEGVEIPNADPLGIESDMAIDPNQQATHGEYEEYELVTAPEPNVSGDDTVSSGDTVGFKPSLIPSLTAGRAVSVTTTDDTAVNVPVATAKEIAGTYEPQDLDQLGDEADTTPSLSFLETTNLQTTEPPPTSHTPESAVENYSLAESGIAAAALLSDTTNKTQDPAPEPAVEEPAAAPAPSLDFSELESTPKPIPSLSSVASITEDTPTDFEQHLLQNLTSEPSLGQYKQMAESALNPDRSTATKTICFVSVEAASHATEVVSHLGVIYSTQNKRVLLVDASDVPDSLTRVFRKDKQPGLKNMTTVGDDWQDMVLSTAIPNLFLMPHGWRRGGSSQWEAGSFAALVSLFSREYDLTLIDAGVAERTEDTPFYAACDRTLLVARLGQTDRNMASAVKNGLRNADVKLDGCVVTNLPA